MRYVSTRDEHHSASVSAAIERGLAPDGGLYVPEHFPALDPEDIDPAGGTASVAVQLLAPFFAGDALEQELADICRDAFDFPIPLRRIGRDTALLELFHGPTAAFKDVGARFLAAAMQRIEREREAPLTVLVATSGDTGGAVAAAYHGRPGIRVVVLFPKGMVSARQEKQLTAWGDNVSALSVRGDFDACQRLVKEAFADADLRTRMRLTSANSINLGRLLPQMVYYAESSLRYLQQFGEVPGFIVPTGNLGNAAAALWAQRVGMPVREVVLATNANPSITRFFESGEWRPAETVSTLASAMDVGNPSNMERLIHLFGGPEQVRSSLRAELVTDSEIRKEIGRGVDVWGEVWDPHTATAAAVRNRVDGAHWILVSTAHPAKFEQVVEPLVGRRVEVPAELARILERPSDHTEIDPSLDALKAVLAEQG